MMISLLNPSRGRPSKCFNNVLRWLEKAGDLSKIDMEVITSIDNNDPLKSDYQRMYDLIAVQQNKDWYLEWHDNNSVVEATNHAARTSKGNILIYLSDDFDCPNGWAELVVREFENENRPLLVKVDDCLQRFNVAVLTIPIMSISLYDKLGYFWHPEYKSMFVDEDLYWTAEKVGALKFAPHLRFPHEHHSIGKCDNDETYKRSEANWNQGQATFNRRKALRFPI